jgi:Xaa-Pro aminopeptidase
MACLLIDSGGHLNGTTDITRVVAIGEVSQAQKRDFTLVLKGMINLSRPLPDRHTVSGAGYTGPHSAVAGRH